MIGGAAALLVAGIALQRSAARPRTDAGSPAPPVARASAPAPRGAAGPTTHDPAARAPSGDRDPGAASPRPATGDARAPVGTDEPRPSDPLHAVRLARSDPSDQGTDALVSILREEDEV